MCNKLMIIFPALTIIVCATLFFGNYLISKAMDKKVAEMKKHVDLFEEFLDAVKEDTDDIIEASEHAHRTLDQVKHYFNQIQ